MVESEGKPLTEPLPSISEIIASQAQHQKDGRLPRHMPELSMDSNSKTPGHVHMCGLTYLIMASSWLPWEVLLSVPPSCLSACCPLVDPCLLCACSASRLSKVASQL